MKALSLMLAVCAVGCQSANKAAPRLKDLPIVPKYPSVKWDMNCPYGNMDEFHRNLFLQTNGKMSH